jgi:segregation and condensation protein B
MQAMAKRKRSKTAPTETASETPTVAPEATAATAAPASAAETAPAAEPSPAAEPAPAAPAQPESGEPPWPESDAAPEHPAEAWPWPEGNVEESAEAVPAAEPAPGEGETLTPEPPPEGSRLVSIVESLLFASDKPLGLSDLKRLLGERDGKKVSAALEELMVQRKGSGIEVAALSTGWLLRTNPDNAPWVSRLLVGKPLRLSRAMLETLAIVAYRQPVTRPEIDDIRGVDCGPVLRTLLDRGLVRIIGKKEEVGRPILYGTTPEFLRIFNLRELAELPTLREFYDLSAEDQSRVEAEHGAAEPAAPPGATSPKPEVALGKVARGELPPEADETDPLIDELEEASRLAKQALATLEPSAAEEAAAEGDKAAAEEPPPFPPPSGE